MGGILRLAVVPLIMTGVKENHIPRADVQLPFFQLLLDLFRAELGLDRNVAHVEANGRGDAMLQGDFVHRGSLGSGERWLTESTCVGP